MKIILSGRVVIGESSTGVYGVVVNVFDGDPSLENSRLLQSQVTNRSGEFSFRLSEEALTMGHQNQHALKLMAVDEKKQTLADPLAVPLSSERNKKIALFVKPERVANAMLPPQPNAARIIAKTVFDAIDLAITTTAKVEDLDRAQLIAQNAYRSLPPIVNLDELLDVALGVLRGHPEDMRSFGAILNHMEIWNKRNNQCLHRRLNSQQAAFLLSEDFLKDFSQKMKSPGRPTPRQGVIQGSTGVTLMAAAIRVGAGDSIQIHRNLGILSEQFCGLKGLDRLYFDAQEALAGGEFERNSFIRSLEVMGGTIDFGSPHGHIPPEPRIWPAPIPCDDPFWPPDPDDPRIPPDLGIIEDCTPEAALAIPEILERTLTYSIDSVSPPNACPGQEVVIYGSNFEFEGHSGFVLFPGRPRGTKIWATPSSYSATEIRVVVPEGAACGDLEISIPGGATSILVCDHTVELFLGPLIPFRFTGGATTIEFFTSSTVGGCLEAGDEITFQWSACNADTATVELTTDLGTTLFSGTSETGQLVFTVPTLGRDTSVLATLSVTGPCGTDTEQIRFSIGRGTPLRSDELTSFIPEEFSNWHGDFSGRIVRVATPINLDQLVHAIQTVELSGARLGVAGSRWSYSDCIVPPRTTSFLVDNRSLAAPIVNVLPFALRSDVRSILRSNVEDELRTRLRTIPEDDPLLPISNRLVHVEAGIKIHDLNCLLDQMTPALALPTLGGSNGQSIAGALNTGTHGGNAMLPPIADFVRAIHLVGPGGQQWWVEPSSNPITDRQRMEILKTNGTLNPCLRIVYDDPTFNACLVSVGNAGIVYSYVIEAINAHNLSSTTIGLSWEDAKNVMREKILIPDVPEPWFLEVTVNPTNNARLTTRKITVEPARPCPSPSMPGSGPDPLHVTLLGFLFGPAAIGAAPAIIGFGTGAVAGLMGALPFYVARRTAELARIITNPFEWYRIGEIQEEFEFIERLVSTLSSLTDAIANQRDEDWARFVPNLLNVIWQMGLYVVEGRTIVETIQNIYTTYASRPEETDIVEKSYVAMTGQDDCACSTEPPAPHTAFERLIESFEYVLPAEECINFADEVLRLAREVGGTNDAIIVILSLRFTQRTRALIGMQQFPKTGHLEVFTIEGLAGNGEFHRRLMEIAAEARAIPHWGMYHDERQDFHALYGSSLERWEEILDRIARGGNGQLNTFRNDFALTRRLLSDL